MDFSALYVKESDAWTAEIAGIYAQYIIGDLELRQLKWQVQVPYCIVREKVIG